MQSFEPPPVASDVCRGTARLLWFQGHVCQTEVTLADGHRADIMALSTKGEIIIVEVKVSAADLLGDQKWQAYRDWCDRFYWAVPEALAGMLEQPRFAPDAAGLIVADRHEAVLLRDATPAPLAPARRKAVTLVFARLAATRTMRIADPTFAAFAAR